jgi:hypothetical protein
LVLRSAAEGFVGGDPGGGDAGAGDDDFVLGGESDALGASGGSVRVQNPAMFAPKSN